MQIIRKNFQAYLNISFLEATKTKPKKTKTQY